MDTKKLSPWVWIPLPVLLIVPSVLLLTLSMSLFKTPVRLVLLVLKVPFWWMDWGDLQLEFLAQLSEPLGAAALVCLLCALAVPKHRQKTRLVVAFPLFFGLLGVSTMATLRLQTMIQEAPWSLTSPEDTPRDRYDTALKKGRSAVMAFAYSARTNSRVWNQDALDIQKAIGELSPDETLQDLFLGSLGLSPNDDISGVLIEATGMQTATFELDPKYHVFGRADTYACMWVVLFLSLGLLIQTGRVALWEWGGLLLRLRGDPKFLAFDESGWGNLLGKVALGVICSAVGLYLLPLLGIEALYTPTLMGRAAAPWFTLTAASVSVLTTSAMADVVYVIVTLAFLRAGVDPEKTRWDGLAIGGCVVVLMHLVFDKSWAATLLSLSASTMVETSVRRLVPEEVVARVASWRGRFPGRSADGKIAPALFVLWGGLLVFNVWGLSNPKRSQASIEQRQADAAGPSRSAPQASTSTAEEDAFKQAAAPPLSQKDLPQNAAIIARVSLESYSLGVFDQNVLWYHRAEGEMSYRGDYPSARTIVPTAGGTPRASKLPVGGTMTPRGILYVDKGNQYTLDDDVFALAPLDGGPVERLFPARRVRRGPVTDGHSLAWVDARVAGKQHQLVLRGTTLAQRTPRDLATFDVRILGHGGEDGWVSVAGVADGHVYIGTSFQGRGRAFLRVSLRDGSVLKLGEAKEPLGMIAQKERLIFPMYDQKEGKYGGNNIIAVSRSPSDGMPAMKTVGPCRALVATEAFAYSLTEHSVEKCDLESGERISIPMPPTYVRRLEQSLQIEGNNLFFAVRDGYGSALIRMAVE